MRTLFIIIVLALLGMFGIANADAPTWQPIATELLAREKPGYGGLCGVAVERKTGHLYVNVSDRGLYRSKDHGKTWERVGDEVKGRTETPGCMQLDPTGATNRVLLPTVYGGPVALGTTAGDPWQRLDAKATHVDWCAMNWTGAPKLVMALKHESGGVLLVSQGGGKSFEEAGKGFGYAWVFDGETAVVSAVKGPEHPNGAILRTSDGGHTLHEVAEYSPVGLPRWHDKGLYWVVQGALIRSEDKGATWTRVSDLAEGQFGPIFGKTSKDLFVLTRQGIVSSADGGATWSKPIPLPDWKGFSQLTWIDYDPTSDTLYAMKMTSDLFKLEHPLGK
jgi:hypothetical protein